MPADDFRGVVRFTNARIAELEALLAERAQELQQAHRDLDEGRSIFRLLQENRNREQARADLAEQQLAERTQELEMLKAHAMPEGLRCRDMGECYAQHEQLEAAEQRITDLTASEAQLRQEHEALKQTLNSNGYVAVVENERANALAAELTQLRAGLASIAQEINILRTEVPIPGDWRWEAAYRRAARHITDRILNELAGLAAREPADAP